MSFRSVHVIVIIPQGYSAKAVSSVGQWELTIELSLIVISNVESPLVCFRRIPAFLKKERVKMLTSFI